MTSLDIQKELTTAQWGLWLRYTKKNNIHKLVGEWPGYDFHTFYTGMTEFDVNGRDNGEDISKDRSCVTGSESVVPTDLPQIAGAVSEVELQPNNYIPKRLDAHGDELPL